MIAAYPVTAAAGVLPAALIVLAAAVCAVLAAAVRRMRPAVYTWIACIGLAASAIASLVLLFAMRRAPGGVGLVAFGGSLIIDRFSVFCSVTFAVLAAALCAASGSLTRRIRTRAGAFCSLVLAATAAAVVLASQREMVTLFICTEVFVICIAILSAIVKTDRRGSEAALKYLVLAGTGSAILLYGLAILYGVTGSTDLAQVKLAYQQSSALVTLGLVLALVGLSVAVGALPLRQWLSLLGEGSPAAVAAFVTAVGISAGAVAYSRFSVGGLGAAVQPWIDVTALLAALTMLHAGLAALRASTLRQLSAQLAGFQAGLMLLAILSVTRQANAKDGLIALLFTVVATGVAAIALFVTIDVLENTVHARRLEDFRGLGRTAGFLSLMLSLALASLGGLPPLAGFLSRILVIEAAFASGHGVPGVITVAAGVLTALASLRFIALLYGEGGEEARAPAQRTPRTTWTVIAACGLAAVVVTVLAQPLLALAGGGAAAVLPGT